jgi:hypothetical protein
VGGGRKVIEDRTYKTEQVLINGESFLKVMNKYGRQIALCKVDDIEFFSIISFANEYMPYLKRKEISRSRYKGLKIEAAELAVLEKRLAIKNEKHRLWNGKFSLVMISAWLVFVILQALNII